MSAQIITIIQSLISVMVSAITGVATGIGTGVKALVENLMFVMHDGAITDASLFTYTIFLFGAISLAISLSIKIYNWIITIGQQK